MVKMKNVIRKTHSTPIEGITYKFNFTSEECKKIAGLLHLKEDRSEGADTSSYDRNHEEILLEENYGISFIPEVEEEVKNCIESLGFAIINE